MEGEKIAGTKRLLDFIEQSPTAFHATENFANQLLKNGFIHLEESANWALEPGKNYFVTRNLSSIIAFRYPGKTPRQILISASHSDSPMFKLKENFEATALDRYVKLDTEVYGGTIFSSWLDRPLSVGGRVILKNNGGFTVKTVKIDRDLAMIPSVAIHQNREVNKGYAYNPAVDLMPLLGGVDSKGRLAEEIAKLLNCKKEEIAGADLFLYNRTKGCVWGMNEEFFSAPRIDNLMCALGTFQAFIETAGAADSLNLWYCADNEETGSATKQGAGSSFLRDVIDRITASCKVKTAQLLANGFMVSADNGHAQHPNHPELSDPLNVPHLNGGVVIKSNAAQHYATDGLSAAFFEAVCKQAGVPFQLYANRSDLPGGATLGSISNTKVPLKTVDIGMAQLAMHSAYETAGTKDFDHLISAMKPFYSATINCPDDQHFNFEF